MNDNYKEDYDIPFIKDGEVVECIAIPQPLKAYKMTFGIEAGFIYSNMFIEADGEKYPEEFRSSKYPRYNLMDESTLDNIFSEKENWNPYVRDNHGDIVKSSFEDIIVEYPDGNKISLSQEEFYKKYKLLRKEDGIC